MRTVPLVLLISGALAAIQPHAQTGPAPSALTGRADAGPWNAAIVRRAATMIPTPAEWDRASTGDCPAHATKFSIQCALQQSADDAGDNQPANSTCRFHPSKNGQEGFCGVLFDENPIFDIARASAITSGIWRRDAQPTEVWAGKMSDAASPILYEAQQVASTVTTKKYRSQLNDYNNDPETTFADVQKFFGLVEARVLAQSAADIGRSSDDVEIELYAGGTGVMRTYAGWFPVSAFAAADGGMHFQLAGKQEVPPNAVDREIVQRAAAVISSEAVWNRKDNRVCPESATTWSIYCAVEKAQREVTGGFHHRRPAGELVRVVVEDRTKGKTYKHRMMDYNNDTTTTLADVKSVFAEALARIK